MVQGLKFLSKKGFNPQNRVNRTKVWQREQENKQEQIRIKKREEELEREREDEELAIARGDTPRLRFMYEQPPGMVAPAAEKALTKSQPNDLTQRQPGDDDAAAAFRRMFAPEAAQSTIDESDPAAGTAESSSGTAGVGIAFGTVLQGTKAEREDKDDPDYKKQSREALTSLEKAIGRRQVENEGITFEEQVKRFPLLANAPRARGMNQTDVNVSFNPLGAQIRNVKCLACGVWGHSRGERECKLSGWDPFSVKTTTTATTPKMNASTKEKQATARSTPSTAQHLDANKKHNSALPSKKSAKDDSGSSSDDSSEQERLRRKKRRKRKHKHRKRRSSKKRKRRRVYSDDEYDSDSSNNSSSRWSYDSDRDRRRRRKRYHHEKKSSRRQHGSPPRRNDYDDDADRYRKHRSRSPNSRSPEHRRRSDGAEA